MTRRIPDDAFEYYVSLGPDRSYQSVADHYEVTKRGVVFSGPLFVMEKMPPSFNLASRDWRYTMVMPDGSLFGATHGEGTERVEFCVTCHKLAGHKQDHLFYVPEKYRVRFLN